MVIGLLVLKEVSSVVIKLVAASDVSSSSIVTVVVRGIVVEPLDSNKSKLT